jgi:hypothetical protein
MKTPWSRKEAKPHTVKGYVELGTIQYLNLTADGKHGKHKERSQYLQILLSGLVDRGMLVYIALLFLRLLISFDIHISCFFLFTFSKYPSIDAKMPA